jgi:hypothetical protein
MEACCSAEGDLPSSVVVERERRRDYWSARLLMLAVVCFLGYVFVSVGRFTLRAREAGVSEESLSRSLIRFFRTGRFGRSALSVAARKAARRAALEAYDAQFQDTAIVTLAVGDAAAKHAVALVQQLRDTNTAIPRIIVLLSRGGMGSDDCHNETNRDLKGKHYRCSSQYVQADDIISQRYLDALSRLGAEVRIIDEIPNTEYTTLIPGGRATFWGMSFNKLRIFRFTEFKKIMFIDADVMIMRNIDYIMLEPDFTAAFTTECCNGGARGKLGGGLWVFEPSESRWNYTMEMILSPCPDSDWGTWIHADMDVVNYMFCDIREGESFEQWPFTRDLRQGVLPGIRSIPQYHDISEGDYNRLVGFPSSGLAAPEGLLPQHANKRGIWHILPTVFDGLVGNCECLDNRDMLDLATTVHFSCMQVFSKPGHFHTDWDFQNAVYHRGKSCSRWYYMRWYDFYKKGMGGVSFPAPMWDGPPVPRLNKTHDERVEQWRRERAEKEAEEEKAREAEELKNMKKCGKKEC